jgi:hypothetical protein
MRADYPPHFYRGIAMGRPKGSSNKAAAEAAVTPAPEPKAESTISKAQAVREALAEGLDGLDDIAAYVKAKHGHDIPKTMISAYKAGEKKKAAASDIPKAKPGRKPTVAAPTQPVASHGGETDLITAMEILKPLIQEHGGDLLRKIISLLE